jgi:hypothetical protein
MCTRVNTCDLACACASSKHLLLGWLPSIIFLEIVLLWGEGQDFVVLHL